MKAAIRDTVLYFDVAGMQLMPQGQNFVERPVLFLIHGGPGGDHLRFKHHSLALQETVQMVFIDLRGCGRSKKTKATDYTLENNIEDVEALRKYLGLEKIAILGVSYGGMVAQGYAIRYSKHIEKLALVVTAPSFRFMDEAYQILQRRGNAKQIALGTKLLTKGTLTKLEVAKYFDVMDSLYSVKAQKTHKPVYAKQKSVLSHEALNQGFGGFLRKFDFIPKLKKIKCPTLILAGEKDWICPPNQSRTIARQIPHAELKIFKNCGHAIAVDARELYLKHLKKFLKRK